MNIPTRAPEYSPWDNRDGRGMPWAQMSLEQREQLIATSLRDRLERMPVEDRRAGVEADTTIQPYEDRPSRHTSLAYVAGLLGVAVAVFAWWAIFQVLP